MSGGGDSDGGTSARVLGSILTWMQEKTAPVTVVATANDVSRLPPELLRKGRWDETFFVDLPNTIERSAIWRVHLSKRGRDAAMFDLESLARESRGFTGAEIEACLVDAMFRAFDDDGREVAMNDIQLAIRDCVPLSKTAAEKIEALRLWAKGRARPASSEDTAGSDGARFTSLEVM